MQLEFEAGEFSMDEIREMAKVFGILSLGKFTRKEDLIRSIQLAGGKEECFKLDPSCSNARCMWSAECLNNNFF